MYNIAAIAFPEAGGCAWGVGGGGCVLRMAPMAMKKMPIPIAETKSDGLRPQESTKKSMNIVVATTLMTPYTPDARSEFVAPVYPICIDGMP